MKNKPSITHNVILTTLSVAIPLSSWAAAPGAPVIDWMETNFAIVEIDETASSYNDLVTRNDFATIPVSWAKWSGDTATSAQYLLDGEVQIEQTLNDSGDTQTGTAELQVAQGGQYELSVRLCNADGCTSAAEPVAIKVEDTDGSHMDPLPMNVGENNQPFENTTNSVVGAYFVEWGVYGRAFPVDKVPANNLTHILYGFIPICGPNDALKQANATGHSALVSSCEGKQDFEVTIHDIFAAVTKNQEGQVFGDSYKGNFGQLMALKQRFPDVKVVPSIGGWTLTDPFYFMGDPDKRAVFVDSVREFLRDWKFFDGVDIDWEFPGGEGANPNLGNPETDGETYRLLMRDLRAMLDELEQEMGKEYELTSAIGVGPSKLEDVDYGDVQQYMDYIFMMTYDFYGAWDTQTLGHQTGIFPPAFRPDDQQTQDFNVARATELLLAQGVEPAKLVVGTAMYGRGWTGVSGFDGSSHMTGSGTGAVDGTWEDGVVDYREIAGFAASSEWDYFYDEVAQAPYIFKPSTGDLITYDDSRSVKAKGDFVRANDLAGLFAWEIDADNGDILNAMHQGLGHGSDSGNQAPIASAGLDQTVTPPATLTLDGSGSSDPDGDSLTYSWEQTSGPSVSLSGSSSAQATFEAAEVSENQTLSFTLTVSDGQASRSDSVNVTLEAPASSNTAPVADAGSDQQVAAGASVILDADGSSDADGDSLSYQWQQTGGASVSLSGANQVQAQFVAPSASQSSSLVFELSVSDGQVTDTDSLTVSVAAEETNLAPGITLASTAQVESGGTLDISASASDPENDPLSYSWALPSDLSATGKNTDTVTVTAPSVETDTDYQITLTVSDGQNQTTANVMLGVIAPTDDGDSGNCSLEDPNASSFPAWDSSTVYNSPDRVSHDSLVWEAQWWTQGDTPSTTQGAWELVSDVETPWDTAVAYNGGDEVNHEGRRYRAQWWTQGDEPGIAGVWEDIGAASCN